MRTCLLMIIALGPLMLVGGASAQTGREDELARSLFMAGQAYYEQGEYELAQQQFERAYQLSPRPQLLMNVATSAERAGNLETAVEYMKRYIEELPNEADRPILERRLEAMQRRLARARADEERAAAGQAPVPGASEEDEGGPGDAALETEAAEVPSRPRPGLGTPALIAYSAGGVGLALFGIFGAMTIAEHNSLADGCGADTSCTSDDLSRLKRLGIVADVGLVLGLGGAIAGTVLWMLHRKRFKQEERKLTVSPTFGPGGGGAHLRMAF
jgi:tetratricopeptide (TPR) repeat protein